MDAISTGLDHHLANLWPHGVFDISFGKEEASSDPLCVYYNEEGERISGLTGNAVLRAEDIFPPEVFQKVLSLRDDDMGDAYGKVVLEMNQRWLMFQFLRREGGVIISAQDITQAKLAEIERDHLIARLQESNRALENFAYVASHDLREPTRKIIAFGERLATKYGPLLEGEGKQYLDRMVNAAGRMQLLVDNLLSFSRISHPDQEFGPVDLERVKESVQSTLEIEIARTRAEITWENLPVISAHRTQMEQLFQNLLANALKFHQPDQPPKIEVRCTTGLSSELPLSFGRKYVRLEFQDYGIGFEQADADRIFQLLERLHGRSTYEGSGIGLAICKKIVDNHQGVISAEGSPGKGAKFVVWLPEIQTPSA